MTSPLPGEDGARFRRPVLALLLLTVSAGYADGLSLTRWDVFVANQSGNVVRIGMGLSGHYSAWDLALMSMVGFATGAVLSWALARWARDRLALLTRVRLISAAALVAAWSIVGVAGSGDSATGLGVAFLGAASMGVLATTLTHIAGIQTQSTYQTANVIRASQGVLDWVAGHGRGTSDGAANAGRRLAILSGATLLCYALGGALGAVGASLSRYALVVPIALIVGTGALVHGTARRVADQ